MLGTTCIKMLKSEKIKKFGNHIHGLTVHKTAAHSALADENNLFKNQAPNQLLQHFCEHSYILLKLAICIVHYVEISDT